MDRTHHLPRFPAASEQGDPCEGSVTYGGNGPFPLVMKVQRARCLQPRSDYQRLCERGADPGGGSLRGKDLGGEGSASAWKDMAVTGRDLFADGMKPGKDLRRGHCAKSWERFLRDPSHNTIRISSGVFQNPSPELMLRLSFSLPHNSFPDHLGHRGKQISGGKSDE